MFGIKSIFLPSLRDYSFLQLITDHCLLALCRLSQLDRLEYLHPHEQARKGAQRNEE